MKVYSKGLQLTDYRRRSIDTSDRGKNYFLKKDIGNVAWFRLDGMNPRQEGSDS